MKGKYQLLLAFLVFHLGVLAQQFPLTSFYSMQGAVVNPAEAGDRIGINTFLSHRQQWLGLDGRPKSTYLAVDGVVLKRKVGLGINLSQDNIGRNSITVIKLPLAYKKRLGKYVLSFGLGPEIKLQGLKGDLNPVEGISSDPVLSNKTDNGIAIDFYSGVSLSTRNSYISIALNKMLGSEIGSIGLNNSPVVFFRGGFSKGLNNNIEVLPAFQVKANIKNLGGAQFDLQGLLRIKEQFLAGFNFRTANAVGPTIGWQKYLPSGKLLILYAYDYPLNPINTVSSGSHEIALSYIIRLSKIVEGEQYRNVRFL